MQKLKNQLITMLFAFLFSFIFLTAFTAKAQMRYTVPNDADYFVYDDGFYQFIYTAADRDLIGQLSKANSLLRQVYEKDFSWQFDERPTLVLPSAMNQITNGFATTYPRLFTVWYSGGADMIDYFGANSWATTLLVHETAHLYQLNPKRGFAQYLKKYFGNASFFGIMPPFTYTMYPNQWLPTFILEGNATFNEGRFGNGGRLYSGAHRALFLSLLNADLVTSNRLINDHIDFPYGAEKYLVGGFYQNYLGETYGAEKTDSFFYDHADYKFNPFRMNPSFANSFGGKGYELLFEDFRNHWRPTATKQRRSSEAPFAKGQLHTPMTRVNDVVITMAHDGKSNPVLYEIKANGSMTSESRNLPTGRIFAVDNKEYAANSGERIANDKIRFGLFTEGYSLVDGSDGKVVYDQVGKKQLYVEANKAMFNSTLKKGSEDLGITNSSAVFGQDGKAYFFRQDGKDRVMYADQKPIFKIRGFYGFPVDATQDGTVYFIATTESGSGLFSFIKGKFSRLSESDTIIDAKILFGQNKAVVNEVTASNYEYKVISLTQKSENPYEVSYKYEKDPEFKMFQKPMEKMKLPDPGKEKEYSGLSMLSLEGIDPAIFVGPGPNIIGAAQFRFSDPLQDHFVTFGLGLLPYEQYQANLAYMNAKHEVNWLIQGSYTYATEVDIDDTQGETDKGYRVLDRYDDTKIGAGILWPYFVRSQWTSTLSTIGTYTYQTVDPTIKTPDEEISVITRQVLHRSNIQPLGFYAYRDFNFELAHEYKSDAPDFITTNFVYGSSLDFSMDIFKETYLGVGVQGATTDGDVPSVELDWGTILTTPSATRFYSLTEVGSDLFYELGKVSVSAKQAINFGFYFRKFPIALRRFSLIGLYNAYYGTTQFDEQSHYLFTEYGGGTEIELLLLHRFPARFLLIGADSSVSDTKQFMALTSAHWEF